MIDIHVEVLPGADPTLASWVCGCWIDSVHDKGDHHGHAPFRDLIVPDYGFWIDSVHDKGDHHGHAPFRDLIVPDYGFGVFDPHTFDALHSLSDLLHTVSDSGFNAL